MQDIKDGDRLILYIGDRVLARKVVYCQSGASRRDGLLGRKELSLDEGILMKMPGGRQGKSGFLTSIHMLGMRFPIAVAWLDEEGCVVHSVLAKPWRPYYASSKPTWFILEIHQDHLGELISGSVLKWEVRPDEKEVKQEEL